MSVLVVEDDVGVAEAVLYAFRTEGMMTTWASTLAAGRNELLRCGVVVLDLGLPDGSGFSLLREATRLPVVPRLVVLTSRDEEVDCVAALEAGADDYVTKPFSPRALIARVRATLRRGPPVITEKGSPAARAVHGVLAVDEDRREVTCGGLPVAVTKLEFDLLSVLVKAPGRVHTRDRLVARVWGGAYALTPRTVDSHVKALRKKLEEAGAPEGMIETVRGVGFKLRDAA